MILNTTHYPILRQIFWSCTERPATSIVYRVWALFHVLVGYPLIIIPAFDDILIQNQVIVGYSALTDLVEALWLALHAALFISILLLLWGTAKPNIERWRSRLPNIMAVTLFCDLVTTLLFATLVGFLNTAPHFVIFFGLTVARIFFAFRVAFIGLLGAVMTLFLLTTLFLMRPEFAGVVPNLNGYPGGPRDAVLHTGSLLIILIVALFCGVNFIVNQRNILHLYLTEQVLNRYLPQKLVSQAELGELSFDHEPERKVLTIMFADLVGFTALSEKLGSDGVGKIINRYLGELSEIAHYHGGTIDKFVGDCIMVFFGAPDSMTPEAQAYRCVEMARQIHERIDEIDWGHPLKVRVGIATGEVVVGHFGSKMRSDYTVIGPSVNLAARLESQCRPGAILLSKATAELIGESLTLNEVGPLSLKGVGDDIYAFEFEP